MDDFDEFPFVSQPTSTKQRRIPRRKLLVSRSEGTTEGVSSDETCWQNLSSLGQTKRPSNETPTSSSTIPKTSEVFIRKASGKPSTSPTNSSTVKNAPKTSGPFIQDVGRKPSTSHVKSSTAKKAPKTSGVLIQDISRKPSTSRAKSSTKSISTAKFCEATSYTPFPQLTTPKRKVKTGHTKRSFSLSLDSDVSNAESSTSSISDNSNVGGEKWESSEDELPSFGAVMKSYAESTKSDQLTTPHRGTKPSKNFLHDLPAQGDTSCTKKSKKKKHLNVRCTVQQRIEKRFFAVKSTSRKRRQTPLPPPSMDDKEVIVISSDNSSSTEPLSPAHFQNPVPDELESESCVHREASCDLKAISAEILELFSNENSVSECNSKFTAKVSAVQNTQEKPTESKPVPEVKHSSSLSFKQTKLGSNILGNSNKSANNRRDTKVPNISEATEWFDKDDIHSIDKLMTWLRPPQEEDSQTADNPSDVNLVCELSECVDGNTKVNLETGVLSDSSSECETAIQLAATWYANGESAMTNTSGIDVDTSESKGTTGSTQPTLAPIDYYELQYPVPSLIKMNRHLSSQPKLRLKPFSVNVVRLDGRSIERIKQEIRKNYVPPHQKCDFQCSIFFRDIEETSESESKKLQSLTVSVDLSLIKVVRQHGGTPTSAKFTNLDPTTEHDKQKKYMAFQGAVVSKTLPQATSMNNLGSNVLQGKKNRQELHSSIISEHHFTKEDKHRTLVSFDTTDESLIQPKSPTRVEVNSATAVRRFTNLDAATENDNMQKDGTALQDAVVSKTLPQATSMSNLGGNVEELHTPAMMSDHHSTKEGKLHAPTAVVTAKESLVQPKSLAGVKVNSASRVQDTNSATTTPPLPALDERETNAAITTSPIQLHAHFLEKPVKKPAPQDPKKAVSPIPRVGRGTLPDLHASFNKPSVGAQHPPSRPSNYQVKKSRPAFPTEMMMMPPGVKKSTTQKHDSTRGRVSHARPMRPVCVNTKPKIVRRMDTLYCEVLCWDPSWFIFPQEGSDGKIIRPCPVWTEDSVPVPEVFESYEQYCKVFSPLLLLEVWEDVSCPMNSLRHVITHNATHMYMSGLFLALDV